MKDKIKKYLMVITMVVGMMFSAAMPAFAYTGSAGQTEADTTNVGTATGNSSVENGDPEDAPIAEEPSDTEEPEEEESQGRVQGTPFSVPGNGQLVDDMADDESKQFLTVQTKNGNTFFMVLDRSNNTENVYMLSMIDENDLAEFIGETKEEGAAFRNHSGNRKAVCTGRTRNGDRAGRKGRRHEYGRPACGDCASGWRHRRILLF